MQLPNHGARTNTSSIAKERSQVKGGDERCQEATMANIVELHAARARSERRNNVERAGAAEVVLFPGVRYERWSEQGRPLRGNRRQRDTLELVD